MQFGTNKPAVGIVYDSYLGSTIDSVLALAMLHGLEGKMQARIASLTISNPSLKAAQLCDVIENFYASAVTGQAAVFFSRAAIGLTADEPKKAQTPIPTAVLEQKDDSGKPVYSPHIVEINQTALPEVLMRNALTAQYDQNAVVVLAGPATNLVKLLDLVGARDLVASKVKFLVLAGGNFPTGEPDPMLLIDMAGTKRLLAEWPTPIFGVGREIGAALPFPGSSIETDFAYAPAHPVAAAYRISHAMPYDAPATDMAAVLYADHPTEKYFQLSAPGTISIGADGRTIFQASAAGKHQYLIADPSRKEEIVKLYAGLASAKPVARKPRFAVAADDAKPADPVKKDQPER